MKKRKTKQGRSQPNKPIAPDIEANAVGLDLEPDAWPKFEKLIKSAAKMGPKPHKGRESR
jgi:hypothetical protein